MFRKFGDSKSTGPSWSEVARSALDAGSRRLVIGGYVASIPAEAWGPRPEGLRVRSALLMELLQGTISEEGANLLSSGLEWRGETQPPASNAETRFMSEIGATCLDTVRANMVVYGWETPFEQWDLLPPPTITNLAKANPVQNLFDPNQL